MTLNLSEIGQTLKRLVSNIAEQNRKWWDVFFDPTPKEVDIPQYDEKGNLTTVKVKNLARIKEELKQDQVNIERVNSIISTEIKQHNVDINSHPDIRNFLRKKLEFWKKEPRNPTPDDIPPENSLWLNTETGEIFVFIKKDKRGGYWEGQKGTIISPVTPSTMDIFKDGSCIAFYRFEGNLNDDGGLYNGVWKGTPKYSTGLNGKAAEFIEKDYNQFVELPTDLSSVLNRPFTISVWIKPYTTMRQNSYQSGQTIIHFAQCGSCGCCGTGISLMNRQAPYRLKVAFNDSHCGRGFTYTWDGIIDTSWHHIVLTSTGLYIDGIKVQEWESKSITDKVSKIWLGNSYCSCNSNDPCHSSHKYAGLIDNLRFFNRALTDEEVQRLYSLEKQEVL